MAMDMNLALEKVIKVLEAMKVPSELISKISDSVKNGGAEVSVVKVDTKEEEPKLTSEVIDKMSEKEAKDALKKEVGCDKIEGEDSYKGTPQEQDMRKSNSSPFSM